MMTHGEVAPYWGGRPYGSILWPVSNHLYQDLKGMFSTFTNAGWERHWYVKW